MKIRKKNKDYKIQTWVTWCVNCQSEFEFNEIDKQLFIGSNDQHLYFIKCPVCGHYKQV